MGITESDVVRAAHLVAEADGPIIPAARRHARGFRTSRLPRLERGWKTLLPAGMQGLNVRAFMQGRCFADDPREAWRFYGRALDICRDTPPHTG
jgi:hypothetical protein